MSEKYQNYQQQLTGGLYQLGGGGSGGNGWRPMSEAPRDGTTIEVRCTYGVAPWYGLYRWTNGRETIVQDGKEYNLTGNARWAKVGDNNSGFSEDGSFTWRPYSGSANTYVDPTGGAQNNPAYWQRAAAAKHGLPLDTFEKQAARNAAKKDRPGFWPRLFGRD